MPQDKTPPTPPKKNLFEYPAGKTAILLLPSDSGLRDRVIEKLMELGYTDPDALPRVAKDNQIPIDKLTTNHVIFTAVPVSRGVDLRKQPIKWELVISPPIDCAKFVSSDDDGMGGEVSLAVAAEIQKHVLPWVASLTADKALHIMTV